MIFGKTNPIGLDAVIAQLQSRLMTLENKWSVDLDGYCRCYSTESVEGKKQIEHYIGKNEYSGNLIHPEGNKFFFTAENDEKRVGNGYATTDFKLYFILNLDECYPSILHRCDNEVRVDVKTVLEMCPGITYTDTIVDVERVFSGYDYRIGDDLQPYHVFRIDLVAVSYDINKTNC